jgi:poly-gamma-glutamate synthesis protein (capsule biosynthesis protein)
LLASEPRVRYRAEGRSFARSAWRGLSYGIKYLRKHWHAPVAVRRHFDLQKRVLRRIGRQPEPAAGTRGVDLAFVGDIMWHRNNWGGLVHADTLKYLNGFDVVLGNLETVVSDSFGTVPPFMPDAVRFNSDPRLVDSFARCDGRNTFTALSVVNNHSADFGDVGMMDTLAFLRSRNILTSGVRTSAGAKTYVTLEVNGIKIGFYAAAWGLNAPEREHTTGMHLNLLPGIKADDEGRAPDASALRAALDGMARESIDFRIVSLHWGFEYEMYPTQKMMRLAREVVAAGADLIIGTHPLVPQPGEVCFTPEAGGRMRKSLVAYSVGNFITAMGTVPCRLAPVASLRLVRDAHTGRVDWHRPRLEWLINARDPSTRRRRLMPLYAYLASMYRNNHRARRVRAGIARVRRHVGF